MNNSIKAAIYNVDDLLATIAQLRAELAAKNDDEAVTVAALETAVKDSDAGILVTFEEANGFVVHTCWIDLYTGFAYRHKGSGATIPDAFRAAGLLP